MTKFYSISIINQYAFVLHIEKKSENLIVFDKQEIELSELPTFIKGKKNLYISVDQAFALSEIMQVPKVIAQSSNVKNYLYSKIKEANPERELLFNFTKLSKQNDEENIAYSVEVIDENAYLKSLDFVDDFSYVKSITITKFALLGIANKCIDDEFYICVHTTATIVTVLAVEYKNLIFSRIITVEPSSLESMQMEITENITQTISYIKNQFREIEFQTLLLSGSIAVDDTIPQQIMMLNNICISVLYPNTFVENIETDEAQAHILSLGAVMVPKEHQFLPKILLGFRQFNIISTVVLLFSLSAFFCISYFTFDEYVKYTQLKEKNQVLQEQYLQTLAGVKTLSEKELETYINHIDLIEKYFQKTPVSILSALKPLFVLSKPSVFEYSNDSGDNTYFKVVFEKNFATLKELYDFKERFNDSLKELNSTEVLTKDVTIDYEKLLYTIKLSKPKLNNPNKTRARRR